MKSHDLASPEEVAAGADRLAEGSEDSWEEGGSASFSPPAGRSRDKRRYVAVRPFEVDASGRHEEAWGGDQDDGTAESNNGRTYAIASASAAVLCILISLAARRITKSATVKGYDSQVGGDPTAAPATVPPTSEPADYCDGHTVDSTVRVVFELPFAALFEDRRGQKKFEASDVTVVENYAYAVCDSSWSISKIDLSSMIPLSSENMQISRRSDPEERPNEEEEESDYEAIFHHGGTFYVVRESIEFKKGSSPYPFKGYHAMIEELRILDDEGGGSGTKSSTTYEVLDRCPTAIKFETDNKGLEGAVGVEDAKGQLYILGLCEANDCKKSHQDRPGNGKIVVMKKRGSGFGECVWETVRMISIPSEANFHDYSAIALTSDGRVAITSQEDSKLWLGRLVETDDVTAMEFDRTVGRVLSFPKSSDCHAVYCNVEGIFFLNNDMLVGVSDKMKGKQGYRCFKKDQSIHLLELP